MLSPAMGARRSVIEIACEMLSACSNGGINKTAVMYGCMLSYDQLHRYLTRVCDLSLVRAAAERHRQIILGGREALKPASTAFQTVTVEDD